MFWYFVMCKTLFPYSVLYIVPVCWSCAMQNLLKPSTWCVVFGNLTFNKTVKYLEKSSPAYNAQLGQCLSLVPTAPDLAVWGIWQSSKGCGLWFYWLIVISKLRNNQSYTPFSMLWIQTWLLYVTIIIRYKMFPMNILLNYTNVKHNGIVLRYLLPPVTSGLVISYLPDGVFSITYIAFSWTTKIVPRLRSPAPDAERNNIGHLYSSVEYTTEH